MRNNKFSITTSWLKIISKRNVSTALDVFYAKNEKIYPAYVSKNNSNHEKQVILLMISNAEKRKATSDEWRHYAAVRKLSALLRGLTSKNKDDFCRLSCLHSFRTKNKLESHKRVHEHKDFCNVIRHSEDTKVLEFNQYQKCDKALFIIYADLECIIEKTDGYKDNTENSSTTKVNEHIPSDFSMSRISLFRIIKNKHGVCRGKNCMKKFCEFLRVCNENN